MAIGGSIFGWVSGMNFWWVLWVLLIGLIGYLVISVIRNKVIFVYPIRIFRTREMGGVKEKNGKGGYIKRGGISFFRIKLGIWPWMKVDLNTTPNPKYMDQDNRVYYKQIDLKTYIQLKRTFGVDFVTFNPVEQDVVFEAILDIQKAHDLLQKKSLFEKVAPFATMVLIFLFGILGYYFVTNSKCPATG